MALEDFGGGLFGLVSTTIFANLTGAIIVETIVLAAIGGLVGILVSAIFKPYINRKIQQIKDKINAKKKDT